MHGVASPNSQEREKVGLVAWRFLGAFCVVKEVEGPDSQGHEGMESCRQTVPRCSVRRVNKTVPNPCGKTICATS